jgi:hypothetical protein
MSRPGSHDRIWLIRVLSLLLAIVIWLFVDLEQQDVGELAARIRVENLPAGLSIAGGQLPAVRVQVSGPKIMLIRYQSLSPEIPLECGGVREGLARFAGAEKGVQVPAGLSVVRVIPATIELKFQKRDKGGKRE